MLSGSQIQAQAQSKAPIKTQVVQYRDGETELEGYLAYDPSAKTPAPGVLIVHEWWGLNDYAKQRAGELAQMGYVAFAVDMYGKGVLATTPKEAGDLAGKFRDDRALMRRRITAALDVLKADPRVDPKRIGAIGYCFGGTVVLELARSGADIGGVVSFHGGLDAPPPVGPEIIKAKVLVLHGADDPSVPLAVVAAFQDEMRKAGTDWAMIYYGGAVHGFTNPANGPQPAKAAVAATGPVSAVAYNESADRRSWQAMKDFFAEIFAEK